MPEAEDVITDAARHATIYAQQLWRRHAGQAPEASGAALADVAQRLDLLISAAFGASHPIRVAQQPAPRTFLAKLFKRSDAPTASAALPATDGLCIWLPARLEDQPGLIASDGYRIQALRLAMRASRKSADLLGCGGTALHAAIYLAIEAWAADRLLVRHLPGTAGPLEAVRAAALSRRPVLAALPSHHRPLEEFVRSLVQERSGLTMPVSPRDSLTLAAKLADEMIDSFPVLRRTENCLFKDLWTGDLYEPVQTKESLQSMPGGESEKQEQTPRSARLTRRPEVRDPAEDENDSKPGAWMVQTSQPHEQAEDPIGMQRPTDRDEQTAAEEYADALSELPEARLVSTPERAKEILLSDDVPDLQRQARRGQAISGESHVLNYPEWDYRSAAYRDPGARVHVMQAAQGPQAWVDQAMEHNRSLAHAVRRQFESLRAQRMRFRKQLDGEEIDIDAYVESRADFKAGLPLAHALYQRFAPVRRDLAVMLLIDVSGSTDAWVSGSKRIIDVEREALLLVSLALDSLSAPYAMLAFSGEGPQRVTVRKVKSFEEASSNEIACRIAALEPEHYTRAGAAIRHATAELMRQATMHRLLIVLSDGKPNDMDEYDGRYGVEDMRQSVTEAKLQGIHPFCLTIDRHAASYLPAVFGAHHYALLSKPELLPTVLLDWMKRLISA